MRGGGRGSRGRRGPRGGRGSRGRGSRGGRGGGTAKKAPLPPLIVKVPTPPPTEPNSPCPSVATSENGPSGIGWPNGLPPYFEGDFFAIEVEQLYHRKMASEAAAAAETQSMAPAWEKRQIARDESMMAELESLWRQSGAADEEATQQSRRAKARAKAKAAKAKEKA